MRESTAAADRHYLLVLVISLTGLILGYQLCVIGKVTDLSEIKRNEMGNTIPYKKASKMLFYITIPFYLAPVIERAIFVRAFSYYESYISYTSSIPTVLIKVGEMCPIFFSIFLATFPDKKECRLPFLLYIVYAICYLFTGKRYQTVASILFVLIYFLIRNQTDRKQEIKWIKKRTMVLLIFCLPIIGAALAAYSTIRTGNSLIEGTTFGDLLYSLFTSVADSDKVIKYGFIFKEQFPDGHFYTLGNVIDYFRYGTISRMLTGITTTISQTVDYAMNGNGYAYTLSYLYYPEKFLAGHGLGSCYIAQLYHDMGYFGVFLGNWILGLIIRNVFTLSKCSVMKNAVVFYMFKLLMLTPRNEYDVILRELCSFSFIITILAFWFVVGVLYRKTYEKNGEMDCVFEK